MKFKVGDVVVRYSKNTPGSSRAIKDGEIAIIKYYRRLGKDQISFDGIHWYWAELFLPAAPYIIDKVLNKYLNI
jgi:hypothetical protein